MSSLSGFPVVGELTHKTCDWAVRQRAYNAYAKQYRIDYAKVCKMLDDDEGFVKEVEPYVGNALDELLTEILQGPEIGGFTLELWGHEFPNEVIIGTLRSYFGSECFGEEPDPILTSSRRERIVEIILRHASQIVVLEFLRGHFRPLDFKEDQNQTAIQVLEYRSYSRYFVNDPLEREARLAYILREVGLIR